VTNLMVARVTDDARWNLADHNLTVHRKGQTEKIRLDDAAAVIEVLGERFGINVADVGERSILQARIDRLPDAQPVSQSP
jgi:arylamine N-acetyltransferase